MRRTLCLLTAVLLLLLAAAAPAAAHTGLSAAAPSAGSTVSAVTEVVLDFSDEVHPDFSTVAVSGPGGVDRSEGAPQHQDGTRVVQALSAPLAAGRWTVAYRVVAVDGHPIVGTHTFDVAPPAVEPAAGPTAEPLPGTEPTAGEASEDGVPLLPVAVGGLLLAGATGLLLGRRGRAGPDTA